MVVHIQRLAVVQVRLGSPSAAPEAGGLAFDIAKPLKVANVCLDPIRARRSGGFEERLEVRETVEKHRQGEKHDPARHQAGRPSRRAALANDQKCRASARRDRAQNT